MRYVALLRGINVGGNNIIKMLSLKEAFEKSGYQQVRTYIQSGNVIFETNEKDVREITEKIEKMLTKTFGYQARVVVKSDKQVEQILHDVPKDWLIRDDIRMYVGFLTDVVNARDVVKGVQVKEGVDTLSSGPGVLYMTTLLSNVTKSAFNKLVGTPLYKEMTIRNYNTTRKLFALMKEE